MRLKIQYEYLGLEGTLAISGFLRLLGLIEFVGFTLLIKMVN